MIIENDIHSRLHHPGVVQYEGIFEDEKYCVIIMEYCSLSNLQSLLIRRTRFTEAEARFFLRQILDRVEYLHSKLVMHRDLKLENILLQDGLQIKIGDFGLSAQLSNASERRK